MMSAADFLTPAYSMAGFVALIGYIPQVRRFLTDREACVRTPILTWTLWSAQTVIFFLYAVMVNGDSRFILNTALFMGATVGCYGILLYQKYEGRLYYRFVRRKFFHGSGLRPAMGAVALGMLTLLR